MTITRPTVFEILEYAGRTAFTRTQVVGKKGEWEVCIDNEMHLWGFLCRTTIIMVKPKAITAFDLNTSTPSETAQYMEESSTSDTERLVVPYTLGLERYGKTSSAIFWKVRHANGTVTFTAENTARSTTYDTGTDTQTTMDSNTGSLDISGGGAEGVVSVSLKATSGGTDHQVSELWVQVVEVAQADIS